MAVVVEGLERDALRWRRKEEREEGARGEVVRRAGAGVAAASGLAEADEGGAGGCAVVPRRGGEQRSRKAVPVSGGGRGVHHVGEGGDNVGAGLVGAVEVGGDIVVIVVDGEVGSEHAVDDGDPSDRFRVVVLDIEVVDGSIFRSAL